MSRSKVNDVVVAVVVVVVAVEGVEVVAENEDGCCVVERQIAAAKDEC